MIVGGGMAGISAAASIPDKDFLLFELSDRLGGTSGAADYNNLSIAQGAHYDLEYPENYGSKVLELLETHQIIYHQDWKRSWAFVDEQYVIPDSIKSQCFQEGKFRGDVLADGPLKESFLKLIAKYEERMVMPTRLISDDLQYLNHASFLDFLKKEIELSEDFVKGLDYHMLDDWGGLASQVSALAGIHYFKCRPYYREIVQLFSPPQGNSYFANKFSSNLDPDQLITSHLVKHIEKDGDYWKSTIVDVKNKGIKEVRSKYVIYAGQKHVLQYVLPSYYIHFSKNIYAPWLVINFVLKKPMKEFGFWQNEMLVSDQSFLGFINSNAQHRILQNTQVLTAYYCLPPGLREELTRVPEQKQLIVEKTLQYLNAYFNEDISSRVETVLMNSMGHAMPIPVPGYLFNDVNRLSADEGLSFAGVDHFRLPVLVEAIDSGVEAVKALKL